MADPDQYNAGRNADVSEALDINLAHYSSALDDLYATEAVWDRFLYLDQWAHQQTSDGAIIERRDTTAATLSDFPFNAPWMHDFVTGDADLNVVDEVIAAQEIQTCWDNQPATDPASLRALCHPAVEATPRVVYHYANNMATTAKALQEMTTDLDLGDSESMPGFVRDLQRHGWSEGSLSSDSFFDFYEDLSNLTGNYAQAAHRLSAVAAASGAVIERYQQVLAGVVATAREEVDRALAYWQSTKAPSESTMSREAQDTKVTRVAEVVGTVADLVGYIPGADVVTDPVGTVTDIVSWASQDYDVTVTTTEASTAQAIHADLVAALERIPVELDRALDLIRAAEVDVTGSFETFVSNSQGNGSWTPKEVCI